MGRRKGTPFYVTGLKRPLRWNQQTKNAIWQDLQPLITKQLHARKSRPLHRESQMDLENGDGSRLADDQLLEDLDLSTSDLNPGAIEPSGSTEAPPSLFPLLRRNEENRKRRDANWKRVQASFLQAMKTGKKATCMAGSCEASSHTVWLVSLTGKV